MPVLDDGPQAPAESSSSVSSPPGPEQYHSVLMPPPLAEWSEFLDSIEKDFQFPVPSTPPNLNLKSLELRNSRQYDGATTTSLRPCPDAVMLTCGCITSEQVITSSLVALDHICPICSTHTDILAPLLALQSIAQKVFRKKQQLGLSLLSGSRSLNNLTTIDSPISTSTGTGISPADPTADSLLGLSYMPNEDVDKFSLRFSASLSTFKSR